MDWVSRRPIALLAQKRFFEQWQRRLPEKVLTQVGKFLAKRPDRSQREIEDAIVGGFELRPLELGEIESISIEVNERFFLNEYATPCSGYHIEATVTYSGSPALWGALPKKGFKWGMRGVVEHDAVRMRMFIDDRDFDAALHYMKEELEVAEEGLKWMGPTVVMLNVQIEDSLRALARRSFAELTAKEE